MERERCIMATNNMFFVHNMTISVDTEIESVTCSGCEDGYPIKHIGCPGDGYLHMELADSGEVEGWYERIRCSGCGYKEDTFPKDVKHDQ